jgi:hypothetical protein
MRRILFLLSIYFVLVNYNIAQKYSEIYFRGSMNSWGTTLMTKMDLPSGTSTFVLTNLSAANNNASGFKFDTDGTWTTNWGVGANVSTNSNFTIYANGADGAFEEQISKYYTFTFLDVSTHANTNGCLFEFTSSPASINSCTESNSTTIWPGQPFEIIASLSGAKSTEQKIFLRYSANSDFSSSELVEMTNVSGNDYSASIPASFNTASKTVFYYILSTGDFSIDHSNADIATINFYKPTNYSYTVEAAYTTKSGATTWSSTSSWDAGILPLDDHPVTIEDNLTLDMDALIGGLTINSGATFTANDNSKETRTLTIAADGYLDNSGTFDANQGIVEFAGDAIISGTLSFYDVGISGVTDFGGGASVIHNATVRSGGYIYGDPPIYTEGSNLVFATGGEFRVNLSTTIWKDGSAVGAGFPDNVLITTTNPLLLENDRKVLGDLSISNGAVFQLSGAELQVKGDVTNEGDIYFFSFSSSPLAIDGNLTNSATGSIILSETSGGDLVVGGSFTDNGSFTHNHRSVFFSGGIPEQMIDGSSETTFGYIDVMADAHVALAADKYINIEDDLRIAQSKGAGSFTIKSDASGSGSLIIDGNSANDVIIEKYIEGYSTDDGDGWHLLSIPVDQYTVSSSDFEPDSNDDLYYYDEPSDMWINWKSGTGSTNPGFFFVRGKGYLCAYQDEETKVFDGALNTSNVQVNDLTVLGNGNRTEAGWNMIGNPYPCSILWEDSWGSDINSVAKVYPGTGNYVDVDPVNGIPSCQAFFVQVTAATSLSIPTTARLHSDEPWLKNDSSAIQTLKFKVTGGSNKFLDETRIRFKEDATEEFDRQFDAFKLFGFPNAPQLYTVLQNEPYSTNTFSAVQLDRIIDLNFIPGTSGQHQIELIENTCKEDCFVLLDDKFTNITSDITTNKTYTFDANTGDDPDRFQIRFSTVGVEEVQKENLQAYVSGNQLYILGEEGKADLRIYNLQAQELLNQSIELTSDFSQSINLKSGIYIISLQSDHITKTTKVIIP